MPITVKRLLFTGLLSLFALSQLQAQKYSIRYYGSQDGLTNLNPHCILQDHEGFLWIGTENGLFRYDGSQFTRFDVTNGLPGTSVESLHETTDGVLWVGTSLGLARRSSQTGAFSPVQLQNGAPTHQSLVSSQDGTLYSGTSAGLAIFHDGSPARFIPGERIRGLHRDESGTVWMWCGSRVCRLDGAHLAPVSAVLDEADSRGGSIISDRNGNLWARSSRLIFVRRAGSNAFQPAGVIPNSDAFSTLALDDAGRLLAITDLGLYRYENPGWRNLTADVGLPTSAFMSAIEDREGSLWLGLAGGGLARWPGYKNWTSWTGATAPGNGNVWAIERGPGGTLWAGTDAGLHWLDTASGGQWRNWPNVSDRVNAIRVAPDGGVWVATGTKLVRIDEQKHSMKTFGPADGLENSGSYEVAFDSTGRLWLNTALGLYVSSIKPGVAAKFHPVTLPGDPPHRHYEVLFSDKSGAFWIGGRNSLFRLWNPTLEGFSGIRHFTKKDGLTADRVSRLAQTPDGAIWIGYRDAFGLTRMDPSGKLTHFTTANGLHSNQPITLGTDAQGRLWYGTDTGVEILDRGVWRRLAKEDGLVWDDLNGNAFFSEPGAVWIGTSLGLSRYRVSEEASFAPPAPRVLVTSFLAAGITREGNGSLEFAEGAGALVINYTALHFTNESAVTFRYRLVGVDQEWSLTKSRQVRYSGLHDGTYQFEVQARIDNGEWSASAQSVRILVTPHWWHSNWFLALAGLTVAFLLWGFWQWRTRRLLATQKQLERSVAERTAEIERLLQEANQATAFKSQFLANMSHEIRTPMNGIIGLTELTLDETLTQDQRTNLQLVKTSANSLLTILNDILDLSKVEAGKVELEQIPFCLRDHLESVTRMAAVTAERRGLQLRLEIEPSVPEWVEGDPHRLRQIVNNLLSNAIKFTEHGEVLLQACQIGNHGNQTEIRFEVADTGIGIPPEMQQRVFGAFQQADGTVTRRFGGTGLGLSIARHLAGLMGGRMWLESEAGKGSRFYFTARFALAQPPHLKPVKPYEPEVEPLEILVAEDNIVNQRVINSLLRKRGHRVTLVTNGVQAVELCARQRFDLVLMDLHMPEMDGLEATRRIRQMESATGLRIVALTADALVGDRDKCLAAGMNGYLSKPVVTEELFAVVEQTSATSPARSPVP